VGIDEAYEALILGFQKALKIELKEEPLTVHEQHLAEKLQKEKFSNDNWNLTGKTTLKENDKAHTLTDQ
jgi:lipoate-protein ligase A